MTNMRVEVTGEMCKYAKIVDARAVEGFLKRGGWDVTAPSCSVRQVR
jgi:hypothetical protein